MYILGIDQGGTKTAAIVCDEYGNIIGSGCASGACHQFSGMNKAMTRIDEAAGKALQQASLSYPDVEYLSAGITGADWDYEYPLLQESLEKLMGVGKVKVFNDSIIAFRGGTCKKAGGVICSGTATNVAVVTPEGKQFVYGFYVQVEHVGKAALKSVFESEVGVLPGTMLTKKALSFFSATDVDDLLWKVTSKRITSYMIKNFAPHVFDLCDKKDKVSEWVVTAFANKCAAYLLAGLKRFHMEDALCDIVLSGSIFKTRCKLLHQTLANAISDAAPSANIVNAGYEPVVGAVLMVLDGLFPESIPKGIMENIAASAKLHKVIRMEEESNGK